MAMAKGICACILGHHISKEDNIDRFLQKLNFVGDIFIFSILHISSALLCPAELI